MAQADPLDIEIDHEQGVVNRLYDRLDELRARTMGELEQVRRAGATGTPQNRSERDAFAAMYEDRLVALNAVEDRLCFGRLDLVDAELRYIGRIGLSDDDQHRLLVDWRAPAAQPFYQATAANPRGVVRRRHLATRGRTVLRVDDDVLDRRALDTDTTLTGEAALLAAVSAERTGRMGDIVATIQAEQDSVIRADLAGVLVVQGGPGTGKTAVALHRAAYLLYTHRERIARSGVLVVGPSPVFLRYIEQVLPALGETGVVMATPDQLFPGIEVAGEESDEAAVLKGDLRMARVIANAVRDRQRPPDGPRQLDVNGSLLTLRPGAVATAIDRARRTHRPHNAARVVFVRELLKHLARLLADVHGVPLDDDSRPDLIVELRESRDVRRELNLAWMPLTPQKLLADLYADPQRLASAAPRWSEEQRRLLFRERSAPWTSADVALLDEAASRLGDDDTEQRREAAQAARQRAADLAYAGEVVSNVGATGLVGAEQLIDRFTASGPALTVAERAEHDRTWIYGHIVVDEAQELSPMMWRVLMRRCPSRSMTVVGDVAQTHSAAGSGSWAQALDPFVRERWRLAELTVNYRTPAQIMRVAVAMLHGAGIEAVAPRSVREGDEPPVFHTIARGDTTAVASVTRDEMSRLGAGRMAVIAARSVYAAVLAELERALSDEVGAGPAALDRPVAVLTAVQAKGLEFDSVVVVEPADILAETSHGANDLYVALTRPTQRLIVVHSTPEPWPNASQR